MTLNVKVEWLAALKFRRAEIVSYIEGFHSERFVEIRADRFTVTELQALDEFLRCTQDNKTARSLLRKIDLWRKLKANPNGVKVHRLDQLESALREYIRPSEHRWLFLENPDGMLTPYFVTDIKYASSRKAFEPAHVSMSLHAVREGAIVTKSVRFSMADLQMTVADILKTRGFLLETPTAVAVYQEQLTVYETIRGQCGAQYLASGYAISYRDRSVSMVEDERCSRVVVDDSGSERDTSRSKDLTVSPGYWNEKRGADVDPIMPPVHPYVRIFVFRLDGFLSIHVDFLEVYRYDPTLADRLILPQDDKRLAELVVAGADTLMEDIVKGKSGGVIVLCTGGPGTGKTLTAEVFSEKLERPLYAVQCAQLGTESGKLEENLDTVLERAERWNAILLIDEADVYVHERGSDIKQNAVVGVMLRLLESYHGVLFLTCNRVTVIDDAVMARVTAHLQYTIPNLERARQIWEVLDANYQTNLDAETLDLLAQEFEGISGRSIKTILKLTKILALTAGEPDLKLVRFAAKFVPLETSSSRVAGRTPPQRSRTP